MWKAISCSQFWAQKLTAHTHLEVVRGLKSSLRNFDYTKIAFWAQVQKMWTVPLPNTPLKWNNKGLVNDTLDLVRHLVLQGFCGCFRHKQTKILKTDAWKRLIMWFLLLEVQGTYSSFMEDPEGIKSSRFLFLWSSTALSIVMITVLIDMILSTNSA